MKKLRVFTALFLIFAMCLTGCSNQSSKAITLGELNGTIYNNDFFGLTFTVPDDWNILTREEINAVTQAGADLIAESNEDMTKQLELSKEQTLNLLFISKHPLDYIDGTNSNLFCIAENLGLINGISIKNGKDYLNALKTSLTQTGLQYTFKEISKEKIGSKSFDALEISIDFSGTVITQKYYSTVINNYALNFSATYFSDDDFNEIKDMLANVKFD